MRLVPESGTLALHGRAHWARCGLHDLVADGEVVQLRHLDPEPVAPVAPAPGRFAGLAFDRRCRLFHALPEAGRFEQVLWGATTTTGVRGDTPTPWAVTGAGTEVRGAPTGALPRQPTALAVAADDHLVVADPAAATVWFIDLWQQEVARADALPSPPLDLATLGDTVFALLADGSTWRLSPCAAPERTPWPARPGAQRLVLAAPAARGEAAAGWVLVGAGTPGAELQALHRVQALPVPHATDVVIERPESAGPAGMQADAAVHEQAGARTVFVIAQRPGEHFARLQLAGTQVDRLSALVAPHYDGAGIEPAPDGRIAYWTVHGRLRHAAPARGHVVPTGELFAFALDAGQDQCAWGRLVVEACIPPGTTLTLQAFTADEIDPGATTVSGAAHHPEAAALPLALWQGRADVAQPLFRDPSPRPLTPRPGDGFACFDAPVPAAPGRFLWLVFSFRGTKSRSPRLRSAVVEFPGHALLQQLPRTLWREPAAQHFLQRLLMPVAAMLDEWAAVSDRRHLLLDARIAPAGALPWLAGFVGLVLDPCWPEPAQRRLIGSAARLFRVRGTLASLREMLQLLTDAEVQVVEAFRLRGGGVVGNPAAQASQAVLGGGYRVGGMIGEPGPGPLEGVPEVDFDDWAHRFTVVIHARLSEAQLEGARRLVEHHKPAHTAYTLCTADAGLRAGLGGHVGLTAIVGRSGAFEPARVGDVALGAGFVLGRPALDATLDEGGRAEAGDCQ